jgi:hypothetical protein
MHVHMQMYQGRSMASMAGLTLDMAENATILPRETDYVEPEEEKGTHESISATVSKEGTPMKVQVGDISLSLEETNRVT